jgi:Carbohydrate esterase 2 N-terminal/GDSL-like Lipase/Acylhydrolase family
MCKLRCCCLMPSTIKQISLVLFFPLLSFLSLHSTAQQANLFFYPADHSYIQYTGRIDFSNPKLPRFWQPGVYISIRFKGSYCDVIVNDEVLWGKNQNYLELVLDGKPVRLQTKSKTDTIRAGQNLSTGEHTLVVCKNTEANIGYLELVGFRCEALLEPTPKPVRKIECIGNSITCGTGSDQLAIPCGKGVWQDQHNAYMSYGAITARELDAQYHLSAVSGVGLMHSCCKMDIIMPQVFDKVSMRNDTIVWDFKNYQPDVVTVCLGQNDGVQDSAVFCNNYIRFLKTLRSYYPVSNIVLLSSPMADETLKVFMKKTLSAVALKRQQEGDTKIDTYFFSRSYTGGCDYHPTIDEHKLIAAELTEAVRKIMHW